MKIAVMPGDGIGKEVTEQAVRVLRAVMGAHAAMELVEAPVGQAGVDAAGDPLPVQTREIADKADAILFGSAGDPHIADHITLWGLRLKICQGFDQYANVRPTRILPGIDAPLKRCTPKDLDWVIVR